MRRQSCEVSVVPRHSGSLCDCSPVTVAPCKFAARQSVSSSAMSPQLPPHQTTTLSYWLMPTFSALWTCRKPKHVSLSEIQRTPTISHSTHTKRKSSGCGFPHGLYLSADRPTSPATRSMMRVIFFQTSTCDGTRYRQTTPRQVLTNTAILYCSLLKLSACKPLPKKNVTACLTE